MLTNPSIEIAQNRSDAQVRLAAQARLYSEVKRDQAVRLGGVIAVGIIAGSASLLNHGKSIGVIAGIVLLFVNGSLLYRERRRTALAVAVQEEFDCLALQLPWNDTLLRHRPTGQQIATAASRYGGARTVDWYPSTGSLQRPLDVAVCQQSNVGWGAPVHRAWAWTVAAIVGALALVQAAVWLTAGLSATDGLDALLAPFVATYWEAFEIGRRNLESARQKEDYQQQILADWSAAMAGTPLTAERCRQYQDGIAHIRQQNALVPDRFDRWFRDRNERAMRRSAKDMIDQAERAGLSEDIS